MAKGLKRVAFQFNDGQITYMNEAVADIYEKRKKGKIIVEKSIVIDGNKDKKDK